ncbi:MAG TPA: hypothetical protein PLE81_01730 [Brevundimonas sp.]|jgi:hypothetical protein|uniref:hypothetical protein n=1 Tax=Brevundimonas sp. TaxID=1871086 RepID=UPI002C92172D|nr:hypothetical protein [Brevundimonas sp.]HRH19336.1 hypothetical protein [Brevundimonas sp.]
MTAHAQPRRLDNILRLIMWCGLLALWLVPLIAKQFTDEIQWTVSDHVFWAIMLIVPGAIVDLTSRLTGDWAYRFGIIIALGTAFVITWANLAVGIVGNEDNPLNLIFFGVILVALIGAPLVGFKAARMRWVMIATAVAQVLSGLVALQAEAFVLVFCGIATALWLTSAALFGKAAKDQTAA